MKRAFQGDSSGTIAKNQTIKEAELFSMTANMLTIFRMGYLENAGTG